MAIKNISSFVCFIGTGNAGALLFYQIRRKLSPILLTFIPAHEESTRATTISLVRQNSDAIKSG
jgi:hypothetical protein